MYIRDVLHRIMCVDQNSSLDLIKSVGIKEIILYAPCVIVKGDVVFKDIPGKTQF